jgi:hypothetical protein
VYPTPFPASDVVLQTAIVHQDRNILSKFLNLIFIKLLKLTGVCVVTRTAETKLHPLLTCVVSLTCEKREKEKREKIIDVEIVNFCFLQLCSLATLYVTNNCIHP